MGHIAIFLPVFGSAGTTEKSPAFQCREQIGETSSPGGTKEIYAALAGLYFF
jgi:hypothetical protein